VIAFWAASEGRAHRAPKWRVRPIDATEGLFTALLLVALFPIALRAYDYPTVRMRAEATEALALAPSQEICMQEAWAVTGTLPTASSCAQTYRPPPPGMRRYVTAVAAPSHQPQFDYVFGTDAAPAVGPQISVTLIAGPGIPPATLLWRCGSAPIASRMTSLAEDHSTMPWRDRPSSCRGSRPDATRR
jgi:hypothetical protein